MAAKTRINQALERLTGHVLVQASSIEDLRKKAARPKAKPKPAAKPKPKPKAKALPSDYDDEAKEIIRAVRPWTMTGPDKMYALIQAVRYVARHRIPGDVVECGVWRGGSMQAVARTLLAAGDTARDLHLFDTYEGMPPPSDRDLRRSDERSAEELLAEESREDSKVWAVATLDDVKDGFSRLDYPAERVHFVKGKVEDTIPGHAPEQISILRLDTDWYESTRHELEHLYPRLSSGGVLLLDDYGYWEGAREAVDEFLEQSGERLLLMRMASGRLAIKP
ncbi:MAG: O-methyltransferase [Thermoleophilaceae bacterium]|nr:O-methyltransferase [Thermoleophilaceae bacterium]MEA2438171.1 O-methyltransferase [Thermoleophilaceae bacterium]